MNKYPELPDVTDVLDPPIYILMAHQLLVEATTIEEPVQKILHPEQTSIAEKRAFANESSTSEWTVNN